MFLNSYTYRENCYSCPYAGANRPGDVTIGDFWNIDLVHPQMLRENGGRFDEKQGISCLIVNSAHGYDMLERYGKGIVRESSTYEEAARYNAQLVRPSAMKEEREIVMHMYRKEGYAPVEAWYRKRLRKIRLVRSFRAAIPTPVKKILRSILRRG